MPRIRPFTTQSEHDLWRSWKQEISHHQSSLVKNAYFPGNMQGWENGLKEIDKRNRENMFALQSSLIIKPFSSKQNTKKQQPKKKHYSTSSPNISIKERPLNMKEKIAVKALLAMRNH